MDAELYTGTYRILCGPNDAKRDLRADLADTVQARVYKTRPALVLVERASKGNGRLLDHRVRHTAGFGKQRAEAKTREYVHVITLAWLEGILPTRDRLVRGARGEDDATIGPTWPSQSARGITDTQKGRELPIDSIFIVDFAQRHGIRQREYDRTRVVRRHGINDFFCECIL
jgi:hypothetical protein